MPVAVPKVLTFSFAAPAGDEGVAPPELPVHAVSASAATAAPRPSLAALALSDRVGWFIGFLPFG